MPFNWRVSLLNSLETVANTTLHFLHAVPEVVYDHARHEPPQSSDMSASTSPQQSRQGSPKRTLAEVDPDCEPGAGQSRPAKRQSPSPPRRLDKCTDQLQPTTLPPAVALPPARHSRRNSTQHDTSSPKKGTRTRSTSPVKQQSPSRPSHHRHTRSSSRILAAAAGQVEEDHGTPDHDSDTDNMLRALALAHRLEFAQSHHVPMSSKILSPSPSSDLKSIRTAAHARRKEEYHREKQASAQSKAAKQEKKKRLAAQRHKLEREASEKSFKQEKARFDAELAQTLRRVSDITLRDGGRLYRDDAGTTTRRRLLKPLSEEWLAKVKSALATRSETTIVGKSVDGIELSRKDIGRLLPPGEMIPGQEPWLNDEVINAWYAALCARLNERDGYVKGPNTVPRWVAYATQWYKNASERGVDSIKGWSRRKGIKNEKLLQTERIFFPINSGSHWTLLTIAGRARTIQFLDSLNARGWLSKRYVGLGQQWLAMELGAAYKPDEWRVLQTRTSQQCNANDCGMFACLNGLALATGSLDPSLDFDSDDIPNARAVFIATLLNGGFTKDFDLKEFGII